MKKKKIIDIFFLFLIGYLISVGVFNHFSDKHILAINFYLGIIAWLIVIYFALFNKRVKYLVLLLLAAGLLNIIVFSSSLSSIGHIIYIYNQGNLIIIGPGINPTLLLITFLYCSTNVKLVIEAFNIIRHGDDKEVKSKLEVGVKFYYEKFNSFSSEELKEVYKIYNEYPNEARIALRQIHEEKKLAYLNY